MPGIPEFQQRRLASSLVGTPGVDRSGAQSLLAVAKAADTVAGVSGKALIQRREAIDASQANDALIDLRIESRKVFDEHKSKFSDDPTGKTQEFREKLNQIKQAKADVLPRGARATFQRLAQSEILKNVDEALRFEKEQESINALKTAKNSMDKVANNAFELGSTTGIPLDQKTKIFAELITDVNSSIAVNSPLIAKGSKKDLDKLIKQTPEQFLYGLMESNPADAMELLDEGLFDELISQDEKQEFKEDAKQMKAKFEKRQELEAKKVQNQNEMDMTLQMWDGNLSIGDIKKAFSNGEITLKAAKIFKKGLTAKETVSPEKQAKVLNDLLDRFDDLNGRGDTSNVDIQELADFRNDIVTEWGNGRIGKREARNILTKIMPVLNDLIEEESIAEVQQKFPRGLFQRMSRWAEQNSNEIEKTKARMKMELFDRVSNGEDSQEVSDEIIQQEQRRINANTGQYELGQTINTPLGPVKVIGFDSDGEPMVEPLQ